MKRLNLLLLFLTFTPVNSQSLSGIIRDSISRSQQYFNLKLKNIDKGTEYYSHANLDGKYEFENITERKDTATAIGTFSGLQSICALLASSLTGFIWFQYGAAAAFMTTGTATLLVIVYFLVLPKMSKP